MCRGFDGLARRVQHVLGQDPFSGRLFVFPAKHGAFAPGPPRRPGERLVPGHPRPGASRQAAGARPVCVAERPGWRGADDPGAAFDALGRDQLAHARAHVAARDGRGGHALASTLHGAAVIGHDVVHGLGACHPARRRGRAARACGGASGGACGQGRRTRCPGPALGRAARPARSPAPDAVRPFVGAAAGPRRPRCDFAEVEQLERALEALEAEAQGAGDGAPAGNSHYADHLPLYRQAEISAANAWRFGGRVRAWS